VVLVLLLLLRPRVCFRVNIWTMYVYLGKVSAGCAVRSAEPHLFVRLWNTGSGVVRRAGLKGTNWPLRYSRDGKID